MTLNPGEGFVLSVPDAMWLTCVGCPNPKQHRAAVTHGCQLVAATNVPATYEDIFEVPFDYGPRRR